MALFQKQPSSTEKASLFSIGLTKTFLIVGLGNIGKEYDQTRHNIGFEVVDALVKSRSELADWQDKKNFKAHFSLGQFAETRIIVIKPTTLMNLSGSAVEAVANFYKIAPSNILVIHDELDINFGQIRTRIGGTSAGHNGVQSIIDKLGEDFARIRIGIGPKKPEKMDSSDFVLAKFKKAELEMIGDLKNESVSILTEFISNGELNQETRTFLI
ncbi:MAG TPA: aminoacyl-tRNA hydrolase [Candidatus Saccharimonadales bacterium]|nr:aminoacyl-tRNA hydrolase [Candidatus Saccharimonadales bacterium]